MKDRMQGARFWLVVLVGLLQQVRWDFLTSYSPQEALLPWPLGSMGRDQDPASAQRIEPPVGDIVQDFASHCHMRFLIV